jgi:hypothetical protein
MLFTGLAIADEIEGRFVKQSQVPLLDRTANEPFSRAAPFVLVEGSTFKMWYWSCTAWSNEDGWVHYNNVIRYAESSDGIAWNAIHTICIAPEGSDYSVGRPWVVKDDNTYRMWFSIRSRERPTYRMGYAESPDGLTWTTRNGDVGIQPSEGGWDSEMICYPCVLDVKGRKYIFYNGNGHGSTGFGYAVLEY